MRWKLRFHAASRSSPSEHRHPVAHIVEGNAQLGLALADLVQEPGIVHRNDRLRREAFERRDLLVGERPRIATIEAKSTQQRVVLTQCDPQD